MLMAVTGITSKTLRGSMTGLLSRPYSMNQANYDLSRLARRDLKPLGAGPPRHHQHKLRTNVKLLTPVPWAPEPEACAAADKTLAARPGCGETGVIPDEWRSG